MKRDSGTEGERREEGGREDGRDRTFGVTKEREKTVRRERGEREERGKTEETQNPRVVFVRMQKRACVCVLCAQPVNIKHSVY